MKIMMRNWRWLAGLLAVGLIGATYLLVQTQGARAVAGTPATTKAVAPPNQAEAADCVRLIDAVNAGNAQTALEILHNYGIAENTLLAMATYLGKTPANVPLKEPFLKASFGALTLTDPVVKNHVQTNLQAVIGSLGYGQPVWIPNRPQTAATVSYDEDLIHCPVPPIGMVNVRSNEPCFIRYFQWYDRYADYLHSVTLNGPSLSNPDLDTNSYPQANRILNALFQLIKARKPDAFVWLEVVKEDSRSDEQWLKAMTFRPDGLLISNLRQFHSPFAETRARYARIVGADMPMVVSDFCGYAAEIKKTGKVLIAGLANTNRQAGRAQQKAAMAELGGVGALAGPNLTEVETNLQALGYRGISVHWLLLAAIANSNNAVAISQSDLIDPQMGLLDVYCEKGDYTRMLSLAESMVSNSAPGDLNWTAGSLYEGIALLRQTPPRTSEAIPILDRVLAFDYAGRRGRDHYIIGAVKWRMHAAFLSGDLEKGPQLARWVQRQDLRADMKASFLKTYGDLLNWPTTASK
jgi:hypothetical protein